MSSGMTIPEQRATKTIIAAAEVLLAKLKTNAQNHDMEGVIANLFTFSEVVGIEMDQAYADEKEFSE